MKAGMLGVVSGFALLVVLAGGVSVLLAGSDDGEVRAAVAALPSPQQHKVRADVIAYDPLVRADVVAYDDLTRAYATARCGSGFGPCPGDSVSGRHLSSRAPTSGY